MPGTVDSSRHQTATLVTLRRILLAVLVFGMAGTVVELLLIAHDEDLNQLIPIVLIGLAFVVLVWHGLRRDASSVRALQATMALFIVSGAVGAVLHFRANMEFQLDIDPSLGAAPLFWKVMRAKSPPTLAPGTMMQLGLIGLAYAYRHPATRRNETVQGREFTPP
jgi:hypothetical protein